MLQSLLFTVIHVNVTQPVYSAVEVDGMMIITLSADGFSLWPYYAEVNPIELLPLGGPGKLFKVFVMILH